MVFNELPTKMPSSQNHIPPLCVLHKNHFEDNYLHLLILTKTHILVDQNACPMCVLFQKN